MLTEPRSRMRGLICWSLIAVDLVPESRGDVGPFIDRAREAIARGAWADAVALLTESAQPGGLDDERLQLLAEAAYQAGRMDLAVDAWERLHAIHLRRGDRLAAASDAS